MSSSSSNGVFEADWLHCYECGKEFLRAPEHIYKANVRTGAKSSKTVWFCGYNCQVKYLKKTGRW